MARLMGDWESDPFDTIPVATVSLMSPENAIQNSEPGPDWSPYVKHHIFWNLVHDVTIQPPAGNSENMTLPTGLALGVSDGVINQILATINDKNAALTEFLGNRTVEGRFWTIWGQAGQRSVTASAWTRTPGFGQTGPRRKRTTSPNRSIRRFLTG